MKWIKRLLIFLACLIACRYLFTHYVGEDYDLSAVQEYVDVICDNSNTPGLAVVIMDGEEVSYLNAGYADRKSEKPVTSDTQFELGSTTKAFTAVGILMLERDGLLHRSDRVDKYLPWFEPVYHGNATEITIEDCLCHTTGVPVWTLGSLPTGVDEELLHKTVRNIANVELDFVPGSKFQYATVNYDILALVLEEITGQTYVEYMQENVLKPLMMQESCFRMDNRFSNSMAQGYHYGFLRALPYDAPAFYGNIAAGYLVSTTKDLELWMKAQMDTAELTEKLEWAIQESHKVSDGRYYWAGWMFEDGYIAHSGSNPNFSSQVIIDTDGKKAVFALANIDGAAATTVVEGIYRMMKGETLHVGFVIDDIELLDMAAVYACLIAGYLCII